MFTNTNRICFLYLATRIFAIGCVLSVGCVIPCEDCHQSCRRKDQGISLVQTDSSNHVFATAKTYFSLEDNEQEIYVRAGKLCVLSNGELGLQTFEGAFPFTPPVNIPHDAVSVQVDFRGRVYVRTDGMDTLTSIGELYCNRFTAGRLPEPALSRVVRGEFPVSKDAFGDRWGASVLTGWAVAKEADPLIEDR